MPRARGKGSCPEGQTPSGPGGALDPQPGAGRRLRALLARLRTHPPPQKHGQLRQQHVLDLPAQVLRDALGLGLALGDDLRGAGS